jgi:urea transport system ATP-binding protein
MSALLQVSAVETDIGGSRILRGVNLEVNSGEVVALMGRNGVGKTTTLKSITGMLPIRAGEITFDGQRIDKLSPDTRARAGIGYVPQGRDIFPHLTIEENLRVGLVVDAHVVERAWIDTLPGSLRDAPVTSPPQASSQDDSASPW